MTYDRERAQAGAALMERVDPGSVARLNERVLDIGSSWNCAVGQWAGSYFAGLDRLGIEMSDAPRYGFAVATDDLHDAWREEITSRRRVPALV